MKLRNMICLMLVLVLLCGCAPAVDPTTVPTTAPTTVPPTAPGTPTTAPSTEPTAAPTAPTSDPAVPTTDPTVSDDPFAHGYFNEITVYPFQPADLSAALNIINTGLAGTKSKEGVLDFQVHWVSFDPYGTAVAVRNQISQAPVEGWTAMDYYARKMVFVVSFTVDMDETKTTAPDYEDQLGIVTLCRDTVDGQWKIDVAACAPETFCVPSEMIISPEILDALALTADYTVAGYRNEDADEYLLYLFDTATNTVICRRYNAVKPN